MPVALHCFEIVLGGPDLLLCRDCPGHNQYSEDRGTPVPSIRRAGSDCPPYAQDRDWFNLDAEPRSSSRGHAKRRQRYRGKGELKMSFHPITILVVAAFIIAACTPKEVAISVAQPVDTPGPTASIDPEKTLARLTTRPLKGGEAAPLPAGSVTMPRAGTQNAYGIPVTKNLENAYDAYLSGDSTTALQAIERAAAESAGSPLRTWHLSVLRVQVLIAAGRAADAEAELARTETFERQVFSRDIFTRALRGEALVWTGDYERAVEVLAPVAQAVKDWRMPTSYGAPPSNIAELVYVTTAQLRTYTALAGQYLLRERIPEALAWASRAETLYGDVHYVDDHFLYGKYLNVHADSFYGRALNLSFLGAAQTVAGKDRAAGAESLSRSEAFYNAIGLTSGLTTTQALRAWAALAIGDFDVAESDAEKAVQMAVSTGQADMIWRVQALRGEALLSGGRPEEAERAFRSAEAAVDAVSGALASDRAKRRFGVGKSDITYRLSQFDIARKDLDELFTDLERGRSRAFVDMMAGVRVAAQGAGNLTARIDQIDNDVRQRRLIASTRGSGEPAEIRALLQERAGLLMSLKATAPDLADAYGIRTPTLKSVQAALPRNTILIYGIPVRADETLQLLMVSRDSQKLFNTRATGPELEKLMRDLTDGIALGDASMQTKAAAQISTVLAYESWPRAEHYLVVPTGAMFFIPWGLVTNDTAIVVLPNAGWVLRGSDPISTDQRAVVIGDPDFGGSLPQLPGAIAEARSVAAVYRTDALSGPAATESALRRAVGPGADILHLATHGKFNASYPLRSALYLSDPSGNATEITARDLFQTPIPARFVVLSACETGVGRAEAGDDFLGLVRSFYLGGSTGVVNSLWPVDDAGTRVFMETFHRNLNDGAAQAWLKARDKTRDAGFPPAVYGAFVIGGAIDR